MNPALVTTRTRLAQAGCVVALGLVAGAGWWARSPGAVTTPPAETTLPDVSSAAPDGGGVVTFVDMPAIAARLDAIDNRPKPVEVTPVEVTPPPVAPVSSVTFHGVATIGSRMLALVKVDGKQRFVGVGQTLDGGTVRTITSDELVLGPDPERRIPLAERSGGAITRTQGSAASAVPGANPFPRALGSARGRFTVPPSIPAIEANAWRMLRAQVENDPQYQGFDAPTRDETATKLLENQRDTLRQRGIIPTRGNEADAGGRP